MAEFRFYYFTPAYDETVAFYRDVLQFEVLRSWDRAEERGTIFRAPNGEGLIEIEHGDRAPAIHGGFYIEVDDVDGWYGRLRDRAPVIAAPTVTSYGHRNFKLHDPNGIELGFFEYVEGGAPPARHHPG